MHRYFASVTALLLCFIFATSNVASAAPRSFRNPPVFREDNGGPTIESESRTGCAPAVVSDSYGHHHYQLQIRWTDPKLVSIFNPNADPALHEPERDALQLRSYNGCLVGPQITATQGETVFIDVSNDLNDADHPTDPSCIDPKHNQANCFDTVNLHFHGYHGSPRSTLRPGKNGDELIASDDVFIETPPGHKQRYEFAIGPDHPAGTFWYHAHRHGSTALQVSSGMAGALIVRGKRTVEQKLAGTVRAADIDTILDPKQFRERILLFQQIAYACLDSAGKPLTKAAAGGAASDVRWHCNEPTSPSGAIGVVQNFDAQLNSPTLWDAAGRYTAINGEVRPPLGIGSDVVRAGDVERWRLVHAGIRDAVNLRIVAVDQAAAVAGLSPSGNAPLALQVRPALQARIAGLKAAPAPAPALKSLLEALPSGSTAADRAERAAILQTVCNGPVVRVATIAEDGLTRSAVLEKATTYLQPGYRSDALVVFPKEGLYCVLDESATAANRPGEAGGTLLADKSLELLTTVTVGPGKPVDAINNAASTRGLFQEYVLAQIVAANPTLPAAERARLSANDLSDFAFSVDFTAPNSPAPEKPVRRLNYAIQAGPKFGWTDTDDLSGFQQHEADQVPFTPVLGSVEIWNLSANQTHIHHIHVNPFKILDVRDSNGVSIFAPGGQCEAIADPATGTRASDQDAAQYCGLRGAYKDTIFLKGPSAAGLARYLVTVETKYEDFTGEFVLHCHILDHEDQGMMANVCIRASAKDNCAAGPHSTASEPSTHHSK